MRLFTDDDFQFGLETVLGGAYRQASDVGEVLATAERIPDGDAEAWISEWTATADGAWGAGETARHAGRRATALSFYRRAATYYATALYCTAKATQFGPEAELAVWRRHRECWEHVVDLSPVPGERISIPYEGTDLRGYFFRAPDAAPGERRPLVIMNNGSDGATSAMWGHGGAAAGERGYHWMTFDGPGQQYALYEQGIPFRHDWEAALTPVIDTLLEREDVDRKRIAVIGVSQAGFWVPRALAFEHRLAAGVADGGAVDISRPGWHRCPRSCASCSTQARRTSLTSRCARPSRSRQRALPRSSSAGDRTGSRAVPATSCSRPSLLTRSGMRSRTSRRRCSSSTPRMSSSSRDSHRSSTTGSLARRSSSTSPQRRAQIATASHWA